MVSYVLFVLFGETTATLLGRLYYNKGGNCIWLSALLETICFPLLIPVFVYLSWSKTRPNTIKEGGNSPSTLVLVFMYIFLGILQAVSNILYAIGLSSLPVSIFSLLSATQLAFLAFFSFFLNGQKLTPPIINSLVLLTLSSVLVVSQNDSNATVKVSKHTQSMGYLCTLIASALFSLSFSLTQLVLHKILKRESITAAFSMIIYQSLVATSAITLALFASGEWRNLKSEMKNFELGKESYVIVLVAIAVCWQFFTIGSVGMVFEVSSLFSNIISTLGLPIVPVLATIIFHDKMDFMKAISIFLAGFGFASYGYQHYLDNHKFKQDDSNFRAQEASSTEGSHGSEESRSY